VWSTSFERRKEKKLWVVVFEVCVGGKSLAHIAWRCVVLRENFSICYLLSSMAIMKGVAIFLVLKSSVVVVVVVVTTTTTTTTVDLVLFASLFG